MEKVEIQKALQTDTETYDEIKGLIAELRQMRNTKGALLSEKETLEAKANDLKSELNGIDIVISSTAKDMDTNSSKAESFDNSIKSMEKEKGFLIDEINRLQLNVNAVTDDINNCLTLKAHLEQELIDIGDEKTLIVNKLKDIEEGVKTIVMEKAHKLPYFKQYDYLLKKVHMSFREMENKMYVSLKLNGHRYIE
ncbi:MAG: hypothetical protein HQK94_09175 [Nitrospirae bacterium]|nr:hypothetical protein [Nitrospirota bacterium]